jgi:hypothetical protein
MGKSEYYNLKCQKPFNDLLVSRIKLVSVGNDLSGYPALANVAQVNIKKPSIQFGVT